MKQIIIAPYEFVFIGEPAPPVREGFLTFTNASCIRVWGTTKGLGEIALCGPTPKTILDPCGTLHVPQDKVILIDCLYDND